MSHLGAIILRSLQPGQCLKSTLSYCTFSHTFHPSPVIQATEELASPLTAKGANCSSQGIGHGEITRRAKCVLDAPASSLSLAPSPEVGKASENTHFQLLVNLKFSCLSQGLYLQLLKKKKFWPLLEVALHTQDLPARGAGPRGESCEMNIHSYSCRGLSPSLDLSAGFSVITHLLRPVPGDTHGDPRRLAQGKWRPGCADDL